jgi:hypothetical protein
MRTHRATTRDLLRWTLSGFVGLTVAVAALAPTAAAKGAATPPPEDELVLPMVQYTSDKARRLATTHSRALTDLGRGVYHCLPWLEVKKESIGFFRPKWATGDDRYLSMRVYIEQDPSPQFSRLEMSERAAAMFSRYVRPLLSRMTASRALVDDPAVDGFTVILEWLKGSPKKGDRPVHETIAIFVPKSAATEYMSGRAPIGQLAEWSRIMAWDGETSVGALKLTAWDDDFVSTYKVANYQVAAGITCQ